MNRKTVAVGLDSPNNAVFDDWLRRGHLPNFAALRAESSSGSLTHQKKYSNENSWIPFLTGRNLESTDYWISTYRPQSYENSNNSLYNLHADPPFYAVGDQARVVMFDLPVAISENVDGIQVAGWASELNAVFPASHPPEELERIHREYGIDPKLDDALRFFNKELGRYGLSYRVPSSYDIEGLKSFRDKMLKSVATRGRICREYLRQGNWDLFLTVFPETHTAGHILWHLSQDHPLTQLSHAFDTDPLLDIYRAVDAEIGSIADLTDRDDDLVVFTVDSVVTDYLENARSLFLPEFLYRWTFPGKAALALGSDGAPPAVLLDYRLHWKDEIWKLRTADGDRELRSPQQQAVDGETFHWQPTNWYKPIWDQMKAFALPSNADGYIRINVAGREARGIVDSGDYQRTCDEIISRLNELVDARTGRRMVERVIQARSNPFENDPRRSPADLVVLWQDGPPVDVVDHPLLGRIGPVPYFRSGGHQKQGSEIENFFMVRGADCAPAKPFAPGRLEDLPATILSRMGIDIPARFDGRPLEFVGDREFARDA